VISRRGFLRRFVTGAVAAAALAVSKELPGLLPKPQTPESVSISFVRHFNDDTAEWVSRFDVIFAMAVVRPEWALTVQAE